MNKLKLSSGKTLDYDQYGANTATPLILLHGLSGNRLPYTHLSKDLADRIKSNQIRLINIDLRGHGESTHADKGDYRASDYAYDIADLINKLDLKQVIVIAESMGGVVGIALAQRNPELVKGLFLEDPPLFLGNPTRFKNNEISKLFPEFIKMISEMQARSATYEEYESVIREDGPDETDETTEYIKGISTWDTNSMLCAIDGSMWDGCDHLAPIHCPLTILRADPELYAAFGPEDVEPMQKAHPHANIIFAKGATHGIRATQHKFFLQKLNQFLDKF
jgi:pimeloyl-ACP methyl ester carboxylesterase